MGIIKRIRDNRYNKLLVKARYGKTTKEVKAAQAKLKKIDERKEKWKKTKGELKKLDW